MRVTPIAVIGKGNVGRAFLRQIAATRAAFLERGLDLRVVAVAGRQAGLYAKDGIDETRLRDLAEGRAKLDAAGTPTGWDEITAHVAGLGLPGQIVVDLTAEDAAAHDEWLRRGWHVVTANKKPLTGPLPRYDAIMGHRDAEAPAYRYEATVGAGLPVIASLRDMLLTGDEVIEVRATVSGTLGFLCSACEEGTPFAAAVAEAKKRGYTEPDPRDDLSGEDVRRKALILARLIGHRKELGDIAAEGLVPEGLASCTVDEFMDRLAGATGAIDDRFRAVARRGRTLRYMLTITKDDVRVGMEEVPLGDGFGGLKGPENLFVIRTARYDANPLMIRGPGAGPDVTAAAVFSDLLRIIAH
jgi:aspartokinase/homoserine dehydrogenase 1